MRGIKCGECGHALLTPKILEIGVLVDELERRLRRTALKVALRILVEIGPFLRILAVETPRLLTSGSND